MEWEFVFTAAEAAVFSKHFIHLTPFKFNLTLQILQINGRLTTADGSLRRQT